MSGRRPDPHPTNCRCRGNGWVCEEHPDQPFGVELRVSCWCEAPGMPCTGTPAPAAPAVSAAPAAPAVLSAARPAAGSTAWPPVVALDDVREPADLLALLAQTEEAVA